MTAPVVHRDWMTELGIAPPDFPELDPDDLECDCGCPTCARNPLAWRVQFTCGCGALLCDPCGTVLFQKLLHSPTFPNGLSCRTCGQFTPGPVTFGDMVHLLEQLRQ